MGLRFDPIGGGQFKQVVKQLIEAERAPIKTLETRKAREDARMKLHQDFKSKFSNFDRTLTEFSNFKNFRELKADLGDGANYMGVTIDKTTAEPGTWSIQIDQLAKRSSMISNGFEDPEKANIGVGYVVLEDNKGRGVEIFVDNKHANLKGIASLINQTKDCPVTASVVRDASDSDKPWKLIVAGKNDGEEKAINFPEFYFLDGDNDFYVSDTNDAQNGNIKVDGFEIETDTNQIKDFVSGVNLQLKAANPDRPYTIVITQDYQKIAGKVKGMVDQINGVLEFINKQNQVDDKTDTTNTFAGDTSLQTIEYRLRNVLHEGFPVFSKDDPEEVARWVFTNQLGIEFGKNGLLNFSEEKLVKNMEGDFEGISEAITGEYGMAQQLRKVISYYTRPGDGLLAIRENGIRQKIKSYDDQIAQKERRVEQKQQALTDQFSRLQSSLSNLQRQQQYLSATLGGGGGGNLVSQLLGG